MANFSDLKRSLFTFLGICLLLFAGLTRWQNLGQEPLIMTDGQGYHAYLPAVFIYHDLQFSFVDSINERYHPQDKRAFYVVESEAGNVNKYYVGTALMQTPFFVAGCLLSWLVGVPVDGYSWPFQLVVGIAAICYLVVALWLLGSTLMAMGFRRGATVATLMVLLFGTNLLYYTIYEPSMSHVYSFFTVSAFVCFVHRAVHRERQFSWILAALALGLSVLIRPVNGLIVLAFPIIAGGGFNALHALETLFKGKRVLLLSSAVFVSVVSVQIIIYLLQTGKPVVWSYGGEGFNFASPEIFNVLFSYRKGLFVYSPVLLLAVMGMFSGMGGREWRYAWLLMFLAAVTWVISSWWMWYYGGCLGQRAFIEYLPFFGIGLAYAFRHGFGIIRPWFFYASAFLLVGIQLIQTYQYVNHILPFDNITKDKYWNMFLRVGGDLAWYYSGYDIKNTYNGVDSLVVQYDMENKRGWGNEQQLTSDESRSGNSSARMSSSDHFSITCRRPVAEFPFNPNLIRVNCWVRSNSRITDLALVCSLEDSTGTAYYWAKGPLRPQFSGRNEWCQVRSLFKCGFPRDTTDRFMIYAIKSDRATVYIDDLEISFIHAE